MHRPTIGRLRGRGVALRAIALTIAATFPLACGATQAENGPVRPYGPNAAWNVPVSRLARHPNPQQYIRRLWFDAPGEVPGNINLSFEDYTYPVYNARDATGTFEVRAAKPSSFEGNRIPWNPAWKPAPGEDGQVIILDPEKGTEWNLFQTRFKDGIVWVTAGSRVPGDYWTREVGYRPSRGAGIPYLAMLVRPAFIRHGHIPHALSMVVRNTDGAYVYPPATKLEHPNRIVDGLPEGMRFAIHASDRQIEAWIDSLPAELPAATRRSARIIARALREYGWFITDTGGGAHLQFESRVSAGQVWDELGLGKIVVGDKEYPRDLLDGLLKPENIVVLVPADQYPRDLLARPDR